MRTRFLLAGLLAILPVALRAGDLTADLAGLRSRVQSMAQGFYPEREWQKVLSSLSTFEAAAAKASQWNLAVEAAVLHATVVGDARGDQAAAAGMLREALKSYDAHRPPALRQAYVQLARCYSRLGDEEKVRQLIEQFKSSPYYDPQDYPFQGGLGRDVPLQVVRPSAEGGDSLTVTAMGVAQRQALAAPGRLFPEFRLADTAGRTWTLDDFRGKVLLVDLWARNWTPWRRDLPNLKSLYDRCHLDGFEVVGVSVEPIGGDARTFADQNGMRWPQVVGDPTLPRALGLFGECANYLVDGNGTILGRNLHGGDLVEAVRKALKKGP